MRFQIYNPLTMASWDDSVAANDQGIFFHTSAWASVLASAYGYKPVYMAAFDNDRLSALLPVMEIDSRFTGIRGVSLPFTDSCAPLARSSEHLEGLVSFALARARKLQWRSLEFRANRPLPVPASPTRTFKNHILHLEGSPRLLKKKCRASTLRNAAFAERSGVGIARSHGMPLLRVFYSLVCLTRKRQGLPPQPWYFFEALFRHILQNGKGDLFLAWYRQVPVAGALFLRFQKQVVYKFGASDEGYHPLRANNLLMWKAIQHYCDSGFATMDFGRTEIAHHGLRQYKRGWGTQETELYYYRYDTKKRAFIEKPRTDPPGYPLLGKLPLPVLRVIGHWLYPHVG